VHGFSELTLIGTSAPKFVDFWRRSYLINDSQYVRNINADGNVTTANVVALMKWKAGRFGGKAGEYGKAVPASVFNDSRARPKLGDHDLRDQYRLMCGYLQQQGLAVTDPIIWPIFLCHIAQPRTTPIYDVNVWLAWGHIEGWIEPQHYEQRPTTLETYLEYRAWFNRLVSTQSIAPWDLDQALITFGRFLTSDWGVRSR
jgi:hypothetical protein